MIAPRVTGSRLRAEKGRPAQAMSLGIERGGLHERRIQGRDEQSERHEVHVVNGVLEPRGHEGTHGRDDGEDPIRCRPCAIAEPHGEADQPIAQDAQHERLPEAELELGMSRGHGRDAEGAATDPVSAGQADQERGDGGPRKLPTNTIPSPDERAGGNTAARPRHHKEVVAREEPPPPTITRMRPRLKTTPRARAQVPTARSRPLGGGGEHASEGNEGAASIASSRVVSVNFTFRTPMSSPSLAMSGGRSASSDGLTLGSGKDLVPELLLSLAFMAAMLVHARCRD